MPGTRTITFRWTGNRPPDNGVERDVLIGVYRRHPGLQNVQWNDWVINLSDPNRMGMLTYDWAGAEPDWGAITSIYEVAAAQKGSRIEWQGRASGQLPTVSTPAGRAPVPSPTGLPSPGPLNLPGLGPQPTFSLPRATSVPGGGGAAAGASGGGGAAGMGVPPWLWAALALLGVALVVGASKR